MHWTSSIDSAVPPPSDDMSSSRPGVKFPPYRVSRLERTCLGNPYPPVLLPTVRPRPKPTVPLLPHPHPLKPPCSSHSAHNRTQRQQREHSNLRIPRQYLPDMGLPHRYPPPHIPLAVHAPLPGPGPCRPRLLRRLRRRQHPACGLLQAPIYASPHL